MEIRAAKPSERRAIAAFCRSQDPDDYIFDWMDQLMSGGRFYMLLDGRKIAGITHGRLSPDGSAWISGERVGRAYRGQGWINRMNAFAFDSPELRSAAAARMLITHDNTPSIRAAVKGGFRPVSTLSFMEWESKKRKRAAPPSRSSFNRTPLLRFLLRARGSKLIGKQRDLAYMSFQGAFAVNEKSLRKCSPWLYDSPKLGPIMAAMFPDTGERWMAVQPFAATSSMAKGLIAFAAEERADSMTVILPALESARRPFAREGYKVSGWAKRVLIFERPLGKRPISSPAGAPRRPRR